MKNFKKVLSLVLAVVMVMGSLAIAPMATQAEGTYTRVESVSEITEEGNYVILGSNTVGDVTSYYAMATSFGSGFANTVAVTVGTDGLSSSATIPVWKIAPVDGGFTISTDDGYLSAYESKKIKTVEATDSTTTWTITDGTNGLVIQSTAYEATAGGLMAFNYNNGSPRFKTYANNTSCQTELVLYKYSGTVEVPQDIELEANATPEEIVNAAYEAMERGVDLLGTWSLTGVITAISDPYEGGSDYKNVALTIQVGDMTEKLIGGYRVTVADTTDEEALAMMQGLTVGDTVKLTGTIGYYGTTVQFVAGSLIELVEKAADAPQDITLESDATPEEIVNAAYQAMADGVHLLGDWELTGVITGIDTAFSSQYNNITVTMQIGEMADKRIQCFRLSIEDVTNAEALAELEGLGVGDTITVVGSFGYYDGRVQYNQGCLLTDVVKAAVPKEDIELDPETATEEDIVDAAYQAMADGVDFLGTWELTGVITSIDNVYSGQYKNITVTMQIPGMEDKPIQCFRLTVADKDDEAELAKLEALAVGDTITVSGTFGYYNGRVQYNAGSVLTAVNAGAPDTIDVISTGAGIVLVAGIATLAIIEMKKRR